MPIIIFKELIRFGGGGAPPECIIYFYYKDSFWNFRDIGGLFDDGEYSILPMLSEVIYFEDFKEIYEELRQKHKIDEELVGGLIREHQLKNLLDS